MIIIGCGISGIAAAKRLSKHHNIKNFLVLEARETYGGRMNTIKTDKGYSSDLGVIKNYKNIKIIF